MEIPVEYFGLIEGGVMLFAFAGWQLWTLREKLGDNGSCDDEGA